MYDFLDSLFTMMTGDDDTNLYVGMPEMDKLANGLIQKDIPFVRTKIFDGEQIKCDNWDAIIHRGSYGHEDGLLEIMGDIVEIDFDEVEGYLTAEEILSRL